MALNNHCKSEERRYESGSYLVTDRCVDFVKIYDDHISLVLLTKEKCIERDTYSHHLALNNFAFKQVVSVEDVLESLKSFPNYPGLDAMKTWISELVDMFASLFGLTSVGLRIASQQKPMCPKFHYDQIPARLIHSIWGDGCQWLDSSKYVLPKNKAEILPWIQKLENNPDVETVQAPASSVLIMKGSNWKEGLPPVIHRSPHHNQARSVLTLDFA